MGKQAVQQQDSVPILHDGPLWEQSKIAGPEEGPVLLLRNAETLSVVADPSLSSSSFTSRLLSDLTASRRIKDQLHILQNFKSSIIQKNRKKSTGCDDDSKDYLGLDDTDWQEFLLLYHLLLEWS